MSTQAQSSQDLLLIIIFAPEDDCCDFALLNPDNSDVCRSSAYLSGNTRLKVVTELRKGLATYDDQRGYRVYYAGMFVPPMIIGLMFRYSNDDSSYQDFESQNPTSDQIQTRLLKDIYQSITPLYGLSDFHHHFPKLTVTEVLDFLLDENNEILSYQNQEFQVVDFNSKLGNEAQWVALA